MACLVQSVAVNLAEPRQQAGGVHHPAEQPRPVVLEQFGQAVVRHQEGGRVVLSSHELFHRWRMGGEKHNTKSMSFCVVVGWDRPQQHRTSYTLWGRASKKRLPGKEATYIHSSSAVRRAWAHFTDDCTACYIQ